MPSWRYVFRGTTAPESPAAVMDLWQDTTANVLKRCTGTSPWTYSQVGGGGSAHDFDSATHNDVTAITEAQGQVLYYDGSNWNALAPGTNGQVLTTGGAGADPSWSNAGSGDVGGPASSTDNMIARHSGAGGKTLQDYTSNPPTISDTGDMNVDGDVDCDNVVVSGNVDGRDVSVDGTKLDGIEGSADVTDATNVNAAGAVMESDYNAQTVLGAVSDDTPTAITVGEQTVVGRVTSGNVAALTAAQLTDIVEAASATNEGKVELATIAETDTGTDTGRAVTPDGLAGSVFGVKNISEICFDFTTDCAAGDGKGYAHIPPPYSGMNLTYCHAEVITAGTTGTMDIQIYNLTDGWDMLSTKLSIDSTETGSDTAATPYVIDTNSDDVATNDVIRIDVDTIHTTAAKGLIVTLGFQLP